MLVHEPPPELVEGDRESRATGLRWKSLSMARRWEREGEGQPGCECGGDCYRLRPSPLIARVEKRLDDEEGIAPDPLLAVACGQAELDSVAKQQPALLESVVAVTPSE